jgi:hypothetical protein
MSKYIVQLDSSYKDVNTYVNQADFAVSFKTNETTTPQVQGIPITSDGYFINASIDSDFRNNNIQARNGNIMSYERFDNNIFLSGIGYTGTFSLYDSNNSLFSMTGISYPSPYLCNIVENKDGTFKQNWIISVRGSITGASLVGLSNKSVIRVSNQKGIYWMFDTSFDSYIVEYMNNTTTNVYFQMKKKGTIDSFQQVITAFDFLGNPLLVENHPYGIHTLSSNWSLRSSEPYFDYNFILNDSSDLFLTTNINTASPYMSFIPLTGSFTGASTGYISLSNLTGSYVQSGTGPIYMYPPPRSDNPTGTSTLIAGGNMFTYSGTKPLIKTYNGEQYIAVSYGNSRYLGNYSSGGVYVYKCPNPATDTRMDLIYDLPSEPWLQWNDFTTTDGHFQTVLGVDYYIQSPAGNIYWGHDSTVTPHPIWIFKLDIISGRREFVTLTEPCVNNTFLGSIVYNDKIYIFARKFGGTLIDFEFDPVTNTVKNYTSIPVNEGAFGAGYVLCTTLSSTGKINVFVSPWTFSGDIDVEQQVFEYDPDLHTFTLISTFLGSGRLITRKVFNVGVKTYLYVGWIYAQACTIFDITDPLNVTLVMILTVTGLLDYYPCVTTFGSQDLMIIRDYVYDITDILNPKLLDIVNNLHAFFFDDYGYLVNNDIPVRMPGFDGTKIIQYSNTGRSQFFTLPIIFNSNHYYFNYEDQINTTQYQNTGAVYNQFIIDCTDGTYGPIKLLTSNDTQLNIYSIYNIYTPQLQTKITLPIQQSSEPTSVSIDSFLFGDDNVYFAAVSYSANCFIYCGVNNGTSWSLIDTILPSNFSVIGNTIGVAVCISTPNAQTPGIYCLVMDYNGYARKYILSPTGTSLVAQAWAYTDPSVQNINNYSKIYYSTYREHGVNFEPNTPSDSLGVTFYVTEPDQLTVNSRPPLNGPFSVQQSQQILYSPFAKQYLYFYTPDRSTIGTPVAYLFQYFLDNPSQSEVKKGPYSYFYTTDPPFRPFCIWVDNVYNRFYLGYAEYYGTYSIFNIVDYTNISSPFKLVSNIVLPGVVKSMVSYLIGIRRIVVFLLTNGIIFTYEVTNVNFCKLYPTPTTVATSYNNIQMISGGLMHRIDYVGNPLWLNIAGSTPFNQGINNFISDLTQSHDHLYFSGIWTTAVQLFSTFGGTGTMVSTYPNNEIISPNALRQSFIAKCDKLSGKWLWCEPVIGTYTSSLNCIRYLKEDMRDEHVIIAGAFDSSNLYVYPPQSSNYTGTFPPTPLGEPQTFFFNNNFDSGLLLSLTTDGLFEWGNTLYGQTANNSTQLYKITIDTSKATDNRILISGISSAIELQCIDSSQKNAQTLYATNLKSIGQQYVLRYDFSITGSYLESENVIVPPGVNLYVHDIKSYSNINTVLLLNEINNITVSTGSYLSFNKDGTLANINTIPPNSNLGFISNYQFDSIFIDKNDLPYSRVYMYNYTGAQAHTLIKNNLFILGQAFDPAVNRNFVIRDNDYDPISGYFRITLNQVINLKKLIRVFSTTNNIPNSEYYRSVSISPAPLNSIVAYNNISQTGNSITFNEVNGNIPIDLNKQYYLAFPSYSSQYNIVPILKLTQNILSLEYTATVEDINQLRISPSGPLYGPLLYFCEKNYSAFYSLQWYPGSRTYSQNYLVGLYDLIIPNRPIQNSRYPGLQTISKYPYIYLIIYNADEIGNFDPTVVNSVYDNNIDVPRFAVFQIPTTTFTPIGTTNDYISATSSSTPQIRFVPGYYKLRVSITDDRGNIIFFDNTPYRQGDEIFTQGVVPEELLNITLRLAFKKV